MVRMSRFAGAVGVLLGLASGAAFATPVPAGTLQVAVLGTPTVNNSTATVSFGVPDSYFSGQGAFAGFTGLGTLSSTTLSFSELAGGLVSYAASPVASFFTFTGGGDTFSFAIDQSIQTKSYSFDGSNGTIALYMLGDLTATGATPYTDPTPTAFTLTLNETGGSGYSASGTLANPPPGSGVAAVPEPASLSALGGGLVVLSLIRRRRKQSHS